MSTFGRLEREGLQRRLARECPPHVRLFWQHGDYSIPDRLVCGRCFAELDRRPHQVAPAPAPDPLAVLRTFVARAQAAQQAVDDLLAAPAPPARRRSRRPRRPAR